MRLERLRKKRESAMTAHEVKDPALATQRVRLWLQMLKAVKARVKPQGSLERTRKAPLLSDPTNPEQSSMSQNGSPRWKK